VLRSGDPRIDGRTVDAVGAELLSSLARRQMLVTSLLKDSYDSEVSERESIKDRDIRDSFIDLFNDEKLPDPARWHQAQQAGAAAQAALTQALTIPATPATPATINELGRAADTALERIQAAYTAVQHTRAEYSKYLQGYIGSAGTIIEVSRDVAIGAAVAAAVVATAGTGAALGGAAATALGVEGTTATVVSGTVSLTVAGGTGAVVGGTSRVVASVGGDLVAQMNDHHKTLLQKIAAIDWKAAEAAGIEGAKNGAIDGVLTLIGPKFEGAAAAMLQGRARTLAASALRTALTKAVVAGASGAVIGGLDAGLKAVIAGKSPSEIAQAFKQGARLVQPSGQVWA
jgi:hypothetical protein